MSSKVLGREQKPLQPPCKLCPAISPTSGSEQLDEPVGASHLPRPASSLQSTHWDLPVDVHTLLGGLWNQSVGMLVLSHVWV